LNRHTGATKARAVREPGGTAAGAGAEPSPAGAAKVVGRKELLFLMIPVQGKKPLNSH